MKPFSWPLAIIVSVVISTFSFFGVDSGLGKRGCTIASVEDKQYVAGWTQFLWHSDSNGGGWMQVIFHPPQFILVLDGGRKVDVGEKFYSKVERGQRCVWTYRVGIWTGFRYGSTLSKETTIE